MKRSNDKHNNEGSCSKRPRQTPYVNVTNINDINTNVVEKVFKFKNVFKEVSQASHSVSEVMDMIRTNNTCKISYRTTGLEENSVTLKLHDAFKEALENQISFIISNCNTFEATLYHGISNIGKSSLALATAYYLALTHGSSTLIKFTDNENTKHDNYMRNLEMYGINSKCLVLDQVNTNVINLSLLDFHQQRIEHQREATDEDPNTLPMTIFTSGHYPPPQSWIQYSMAQNTKLHYRMIDMVLTEEAVKCLLMETCTNLVQHARDIWILMKSYGKIKYENRKLLQSVGQPSQFADILFDLDEINNATKLNLREIAWVLFPAYFSKNFKNEQQQSFLKNGDAFFLEPEHLTYLSLCLYNTKINDMSANDAMLSILNWMVVIQKKESDSGGLVRQISKNNKSECGYKEMKPGLYCFAFANDRFLELILQEGSTNYSEEYAMETYKVAFEFLTSMNHKEMNHMREGLFGMYIKLFLKVRLDNRAFKLTEDFKTKKLNLSPVHIDVHEEVNNMDELVNKIVSANNYYHTRNIWFELETQFLGYDFVFASVNHNPNRAVPFQVLDVNFFQCTVSPASLHTSIDVMGEPLQAFVDKIKSFKGNDDVNDIEMKVKICIIVPNDVQTISRPIKISSNGKYWDVPILRIENDKFEL